MNILAALKHCLILVAIITLFACGGGGSSDPKKTNEEHDGSNLEYPDPSNGDEPEPQPPATVESLLGTIPAGVSYSISIPGSELTTLPVEQLPKSVAEPVVAFAENGDAIYWGNAQTLAVSDHLLDARSTAMMLLYVLIVPVNLDDESQVQVLTVLNQHSDMDEFAKAIEDIVQAEGHLNFESFAQQYYDLASKIIDDVNQQLSSSAASASTNRVQISSVGSHQTGDDADEDELAISFLEFTQIDDDNIQVDITINNSGKLFYETYLTYEDIVQEAFDTPSIFPEDDIDLINLSSSVGGSLFGIGNEFAITDLARSKNTDIRVTVPTQWSLSSPFQFNIVADPTRPYPALMNIVNAFGPIVGAATGYHWDSSKISDYDRDLIGKIIQFATAREDDIQRAYNGLETTVAFALVREFFVDTLGPSLSTSNPRLHERFFRIGTGIFNFAKHVTTAVNTAEMIESMSEGEIETFVIQPIPISIVDINETSSGIYDVTFRAWGTDNEWKIGDNTTEIILYAFQFWQDNIPKSDSIYENIEAVYAQGDASYANVGNETFLIENLNHNETITVSFDTQLSGPVWIAAIPGFNAPCTNCSYLFPERSEPPFLVQTPDHRTLLLIGQNLVFAGSQFCPVPSEISLTSGIEVNYSYSYRDQYNSNSLFSENILENLEDDFRGYFYQLFSLDNWFYTHTDVYSFPDGTQIAISCDSESPLSGTLIVEEYDSEGELTGIRHSWDAQNRYIAIPYQSGVANGVGKTFYDRKGTIPHSTFDLVNDTVAGLVEVYREDGRKLFQQNSTNTSCIYFQQQWFELNPDWTDYIQRWDCDNGEPLAQGTWVDNNNSADESGEITGHKYLETDYEDGVKRESRLYSSLSDTNYDDHVWHRYIFNALEQLEARYLFSNECLWHYTTYIPADNENEPIENIHYHTDPCNGGDIWQHYFYSEDRYINYLDYPSRWIERRISDTSVILSCSMGDC